MEYRPFGNTGLNVSTVGFGCWEMGGGYGSLDEAEAIAAVHTALDLGINLFDTAEGYGFGRSEELLAKALGNRRRDVIVVTKFGVAYDNDRPRGADGSRSRVKSSIEERLTALGTDYIDVYLVHWPDRKTPFDETMQALDEIVQEGKARYVGLCNFKPHELQACHTARPLDVVQYPYHMMDRRMADWIFPYAEQQGIGLMTYGTLAYGLLTGAMTEQTRFPESDWRSAGGQDFALWLFAEEVLVRNVRLAKELSALARSHGFSLPQLAIRWATSHPAVSVSLVGARRPSEVEDNAAAAEKTVPAGVFEAVDALMAEYEINMAPNKWIEREDVIDRLPPWRDASRPWAKTGQ